MCEAEKRLLHVTQIQMKLEYVEYCTFAKYRQKILFCKTLRGDKRISTLFKE